MLLIKLFHNKITKIYEKNSVKISTSFELVFFKLLCAPYVFFKYIAITAQSQKRHFADER